MTRKKAIDTAVEIGWKGSYIMFDRTKCYQVVAGRAYDLGRIAGLREGAKMAMTDGGWTPMVGMVQRKARALAKALPK